MTKNKLSDLSLHLFEQLERLSDEDCDLETEIKRANAISKISSQIIQTANVAIKAEELKANTLDANFIIPHMLESGE